MQEVPWWPSGEDLVLSAAKSRIQSPVKELRSCKLHGTQNKILIKCKIYSVQYMCGADWRQEEKGATEDELAGWHHRLDAHEFE